VHLHHLRAIIFMKKIQDCLVHQLHHLNTDNYILEMKVPGAIPPVGPGQFAEIRIDNAPGVFLRRPFSILDVDYDHRTIQFYIKAVGKGTRKLSGLKAGEWVNIIYPLGNQFTITNTRAALIVGGGSGIAPFILLAKELQKHDTEMTFLIGGKKEQDIFLTKELGRFGKVLVTTEDGSLGEKGLVTQHSVFKTLDPAIRIIYTCGPEPMMKAVSEIAHLKGIPCEASLENLMACGFGACLCCITETADGNKCVCTEGPVFNTNYLKW
jgi:dihydroorotate dehydrogenase electron transfer subunit